MKKFLLKCFVVLAWASGSNAQSFEVDCSATIGNQRGCFFYDTEKDLPSVNPWILEDDSIRLPDGTNLYYDFQSDDDVESEILDLLRSPHNFGVEQEPLYGATWSELEDGGGHAR